MSGWEGGGAGFLLTKDDRGERSLRAAKVARRIKYSGGAQDELRR
jgi:hypothetical protein